MAFPTTSVLDNFDRANQDPLSTANWTQGIRSEGANYRLQSSAIRHTAPASASVYWSPSFTTDQEAYFTMSALTSTEGDFVAIGLRLGGTLPGSGTGYEVVLWSPNPTFRRVELWQMSGSYIGNIGTNTLSFSAGDKFGASVIGSTITAYQRTGGVWNTIGSVVDYSWNRSGQIGIRSSQTTDVLIVDDFGGGSIPLVSDTPFPPAGRGATW